MVGGERGSKETSGRNATLVKEIRNVQSPIVEISPFFGIDKGDDTLSNRINKGKEIRSINKERIHRKGQGIYSEAFYGNAGVVVSR